MMMNTVSNTTLAQRLFGSAAPYPSLFGFAFWWAWWDVFRVSDTHLIPSAVAVDAETERICIELGFFIAAVVLAIAARRGFSLFDKGLLLNCIAAGLVVCMGLFYAPLVGVERVAPLLLQFLMGVGGAMLYFAWFELYSVCDVPHPVAIVACCLLVNAVVLVAVLLAHFYLPPLPIAAMHAALPIASCAMLMKGIAGQRSSHERFLAQQVKLVFLPQKLFIAVFVFGFVFGLVLNFTPGISQGPGEDAHYPLFLEIAGIALGGILFLLLGRAFSSTPEKAFSVRWATVPFIVFSLLSIPVVGVVNPFVSKAFLWAGYEYLDLMMMAIYIRIARELRTSPLMVNTQGQAADVGGIVLGMLLGTAMNAAALSQMGSYLSGIVMAAVMAVIIVAFYIMTDRNIATIWGLQKKSPKARDEERKAARVASFAQGYGLTPRERDVLAELVEQRRPELIAEKLFISLGTVRSHIARIYAKTGVHSQIDLVKKYEDESERVS